MLSIITVLVWLCSGPLFHFSDTWLITITVITDIIIFVMVFSIQNTQFRDSKAIQLKLNELIKSDQKARDTFIGLETLTDTELSVLDKEFKLMLTKMDVHPVVKKLHTSIKSEQQKRPALLHMQLQPEQLVEKLIHPNPTDRP